MTKRKKPADPAPKDHIGEQDGRPVPPVEALQVPSAARERIRLAIVSLHNEGADVTTAAIRSRARVSPTHAAQIRALYQEGRMPDLWHPWDTDPGDGPRAGLEASVMKAGSFEEVAAAQRTVAAALASGAIEPSVGRALSEVLTQQRLALQGARDAGQGGEAPTWSLVSAEASRVAEAVDMIVSEERRARVLDMIARELELDMVEHPAIDTTERGAT